MPILTVTIDTDDRSAKDIATALKDMSDCIGVVPRPGQVWTVFSRDPETNNPDNSDPIAVLSVEPKFIPETSDGPADPDSPNVEGGSVSRNRWTETVKDLRKIYPGATDNFEATLRFVAEVARERPESFDGKPEVQEIVQHVFGGSDDVPEGEEQHETDHEFYDLVDEMIQSVVQIGQSAPEPLRIPIMSALLDEAAQTIAGLAEERGVSLDIPTIEKILSLSTGKDVSLVVLDV